MSRTAELEQMGAWYGQRGYAIAWTHSTGPCPLWGKSRHKPASCGYCKAAKGVYNKGWHYTPPLLSAEAGARAFRENGERHNPAIVLRTSELVGFEVDGERELEIYKLLQLPKTVHKQSSAPDRVHYLFRPPVRVRASDLPYVGFRVENGKILADKSRFLVTAPGTHPSGARYGVGFGEEATLPGHLYDQVLRVAGKDGADPPKPASTISSARYGVTSLDHGENASLDVWEKQPEFAWRVAEYLGLPDKAKKNFRCSVHPDREHNAQLVFCQDGSLGYQCFGSTTGGHFTLVEVFCAKQSGEPYRLLGVENRTWQNRLLIEAGIIAPPQLRGVLPLEGLGKVERKLYLGFRLLLAARGLGEEGPAMFTAGFAARWCGVPVRSAAQALNSLARKGYLVLDGTRESSKGHPTRLWRLGESA
jgi:Bifunctional DNA primase/polymerase, N-terminal